MALEVVVLPQLAAGLERLAGVAVEYGKILSGDVAAYPPLAELIVEIAAHLRAYLAALAGRAVSVYEFYGRTAERGAVAYVPCDPLDGLVCRRHIVFYIDFSEL